MNKLNANEAINFTKKSKDNFSEAGAEIFEEFQARIRYLRRAMILKELIPKNDLTTEKDVVPNYPKFIQDCAESHEKNAGFRYSIMMCLLETVATSCNSQNKRIKCAGIGL